MTFSNPLDLHRNIIKKVHPEMVYTDDQDFSLWQCNAKKKLSELLGLPFVRSDMKFDIQFINQESSIKDVSCTEVRFTFQSEQGYFVPCHLFLPHNSSDHLSLVICLQGHSTGMHISMARTKYSTDTEESYGGDRDFAVQSVRQGYAALTIEQRCFGECGGAFDGPDCYQSSMTALLAGRTTLGERVWDISRAIDIIEAHFPMIDKAKISCMGNSGGGTATYYAACLDERISTAMVSCALCSFSDSIANCFHCSCNYIPGIIKYFEMGDLAGLIAPRPLIIVAGKEDTAFPLEGVKSAFNKVLSLYKAANAENNCRLIIGGEGHRFYADLSWPVFNEFFHKQEG